MRLARAGSPAALIDRLFRIDATRAPLHPMLLEGWIGVFGASEAAARALERALRASPTVLLVFDIGRVAFGTRTGLWAAWLAALSPALDRLRARGADVCLARPGDLPLLAAAAGPAGVVHDGQGGGLHPQPGRAGVFAPARPADAGDARAGRPDRHAAVLRLVEAMAGGPPGRRRAGRALGAPLPRSSGRVPDRSAPAQVPPGHADRVHRRKLAGPGGPGRADRLGDCASSGGRGSVRAACASGRPSVRPLVGSGDSAADDFSPLGWRRPSCSSG